MDVFSAWLKNIVIITVTMTLLHMVLPKTMGKYVKIVTGFVVVLAIIQPFTDVLDTDFYLQNLMLKHDLIMKENTVNRVEPVLTEEKVAGERELTVDVYKSKLSENIEQNIAESLDLRVKVDLTINEDLDDENFGTLNSAQVVVLSESGGDKIDPIEKITIGKDEKKEGKGVVSEKTAEALNNFFLNFYNLESENISISRRK